jgi:uncharacterized protein (DUF1810 family)
MPDHPFDLGRFTKAQEDIYERALAELRAGRKRSHWMWYVFPQFDGLGFSSTTKWYSIKSLEEARQYLSHPVLGPRLEECVGAILAVDGRSAAEIFGSPDDMKLQSSLTLFACVSGPGSPFVLALDKYFHGQKDTRTLELLDKSGSA